MEIKLPAPFPVFIRHFVGGILKTAAEKWFDVIVLAVAALYAILGKHDNAWDAITPFVWIVCIILVIHVVRAAVQVWRENQRSINSPLIITLDKSRVPPPRNHLAEKLVLISGVSLALLVTPIYLVEHMATVETKPFSAPPPPAAPLDLAIFMECNIKGLPLTIPALSAIQVVPVNEAYMRSNHWGSYKINNDTSSPKQWPDPKVMRDAKRQHDPGVFAYDCKITNIGSSDVLDVSIPIRFWFGQKGGEQNAVPFATIISPLYPGASHSEDIYFVNDCSVSAAALLPSSVTLQVIGEAKRRRVALDLPHRNPVEPLMMWFPTKIQFVRATQCN